MHADPPTKRHSILTRRHLGLNLIACLFECSLVFVIVKKDRIFFGFICSVQQYAQYIAMNRLVFVHQEITALI